MTSTFISKHWLEDLYNKYNKRKFVHPDPLEFLYAYPTIQDREIVGLIASSLAYGNVKQILSSISKALAPLGEKPSEALTSLKLKELLALYKNFKHRFTTGEELAVVLYGTSKLIAEYNGIGNAVGEFWQQTGSVVEAQSRLVRMILKHAQIERSTLLPEPLRRSACKRLNLFFRWMVRKDEVDPGGWEEFVPRSHLIVPIDTHMFAFARKYQLTQRKSADLKTALEITRAFAQICPEDPVKYDFAITRSGIAKLYEI